MRWAARVVGILLALVGLLWVLQGANALAGSAMSGQPFWAGAGIVLILAGVVLLSLSLRRRVTQPSS